MKVTPEGVSNFYSAALDACVQRGMPLPYIVVAASIDGIVMATRFKEVGGEPEVLVDMPQGTTFKLPINAMIIDATGEAARVVLSTTDGHLTVHYQNNKRSRGK